MKTDYIADGWQEFLRHNNLESFEALWALEVEWFEPPNQRRGGWSGVARIQLEEPDGGKVKLFLKKQENHFCRTPLRPGGMLTFEREFNNLRRFQRLEVPTLEPVYFGQSRKGGNSRAILITKELEGFQPLSDEELIPGRGGPFDPIETRKAFFSELAESMRRLHAAHLQHGALHLKHIFVRQSTEGSIKHRLIDLEKTRWQPLKRRAAFRDLYSLSRHAFNWSRNDHMRFFLIYRQERHLSTGSKRLWREITGKMAGKTSTTSIGNKEG